MDARNTWRAWALLGGAFVAMGVWLWHVPVNHDSAYIMLAARRWLDGWGFYTDQFMANPPLAPWLHAGVVAVDRALGGVTPDPFALQLWPMFVLGVVAVAMGVSGAVLGAYGDAERMRRPTLLVTAFAALAVAPVFDFGQRDHLFAVCAFAYVVLAGARYDGVRVPWALAAAVGALAFFGVALKPHFALLPIALEMVLRLRAGNVRGVLRPETLTLAGVMIGYAALVVEVYPEYFSTTLYLYTKVFFAFTKPVTQLVIRPEVVIALVAALAWARAGAGRGDGQTLMAVTAMAAALAIFLLQKKGWSYQRAPLFVFAVWTLGRIAFTEPAGRRTWAVAGLVMALLLVSVRGAYANDYARTVVPEVARHADGGAAYVFTTNVSVAYPGLMYAGVTPASRFNTLWMLPGLVRTRVDAPKALSTVEAFARQAVIEDFRRHVPSVVVVDARSPKPYFNGVAFDYLDWALQDPRFAEVWRDYTRVDQAFGFDIYIRKPEGEGRP